MPELLIIDVTALPDEFLEQLHRVARLWAGSRNVQTARWGSELAAAVSSVRSARNLSWLDLVDAHGFPAWDTCVDALPAREA